MFNGGHMTNMNQKQPVYKDGKVIGHVNRNAWKQASKILGTGAKLAKRECGWCWTDK